MLIRTDGRKSEQNGVNQQSPQSRAPISSEATSPLARAVNGEEYRPSSFQLVKDWKKAQGQD